MHATKNPPSGGQDAFRSCHSTTPPTVPPDFEQDSRFLTLLDETAERWTFQTFDNRETAS